MVHSIVAAIITSSFKHVSLHTVGKHVQFCELSVLESLFQLSPKRVCLSTLGSICQFGLPPGFFECSPSNLSSSYCFKTTAWEEFPHIAQLPCSIVEVDIVTVITMQDNCQLGQQMHMVNATWITTFYLGKLLCGNLASEQKRNKMPWLISFCHIHPFLPFLMELLQWLNKGVICAILAACKSFTWNFI